MVISDRENNMKLSHLLNASYYKFINDYLSNLSKCKHHLLTV